MSTTSSSKSTSSTAAAAAALPDVNAAESATTTDLCIGITQTTASVSVGTPAEWIITAWATGGNITTATVSLQATPSSVTPEFSFGCGSYDGTASCDLGAMDSTSAQRQLQAEVLVPTTTATSSITSVKLTAIGDAANLSTDPKASASITITDSTSTGAGSDTLTSPLDVGTLPGIPTPSSTLSPGGNAGGLFPSLSPSGSAPESSQGSPTTARAVADTSALPQGAQVIGAQLIGLAALALAFILAITRLSIRRRPATASATAGAGTASTAATGTHTGTGAGSAGADDATPESTAPSRDPEPPSAAQAADQAHPGAPETSPADPDTPDDKSPDT